MRIFYPQNIQEFVVTTSFYQRIMLLKTSVESIFDFPQHLQKVVTKWRQLKRKGCMAGRGDTNRTKKGPSTRCPPVKYEKIPQLPSYQSKMHTLLLFFFFFFFFLLFCLYFLVGGGGDVCYSF